MTIVATGYLHPTKMLFKNIGMGPAVGVQVFNEPGVEEAALGTADVIYPENNIPQPAIEADRPHGMISFPEDADFDPPPGKTYRILYQDLDGAWHESRATYEAREVKVAYLGRYRWWHWYWSPDRRIPKAAIRAAHVVGPVEG